MRRCAATPTSSPGSSGTRSRRGRWSPSSRGIARSPACRPRPSATPRSMAARRSWRPGGRWPRHRRRWCRWSAASGSGSPAGGATGRPRPPRGRHSRAPWTAPTLSAAASGSGAPRTGTPSGRSCTTRAWTSSVPTTWTPSTPSFDANLAPGGRVLLPDPFRSVSLRLLEAMDANGWTVTLSKWSAGEETAPRSIGVFELARPVRRHPFSDAITPAV